MSSEETTKTESPVAVSQNSSNKTVLFALIGLAVVVVAIGAFLLISRGGVAGINGKSIPSDWETFENEVFSLGHPKDFEVSESFNGMTIGKKSEDSEDFLGSLSSMMVNFSNGEEELVGEARDIIDAVMKGDCSGLEDVIKSSVGDSIEGVSFSMKSTAVDFNNAKGCKYEATVSVLGFNSNVEGVGLISKSDSSKSVAFTITSLSGENKDANVFRDIISTVSFK